MKKLIAFDMDGTLAPSKSTMPGRMARLVDQLLEKYEMCIISGGKYELFQSQSLTQITQSPELLTKLHLMPTCGTRYYSYDTANNDWKLNYAEDFTYEEKEKIKKALHESLNESGYKVEKTYGETVEDRESQISLSIFGQDIVAELGDEGLHIKESWDPNGDKKLKIREIVAAKIPEFEVRAAGATTIDVTKLGIDKAYGMNKLMEARGLTKEDILFFGDKLEEGGNDFPVREMGIDCIEVRNWEDTSYAVEALVKGFKL